jgi:hypothetical protein
MKNNPLSSLATPEQKKENDKIRIYSVFYPFKQKKLNQVGNEVKKILSGFNINYPIIFDFRDVQGSKYRIASIDSNNYYNYNIFIHYNPCFIAMEFDQLVLTGLHEYCHIFYRQKEHFSNKDLQHFFPNIDYDRYITSIDYLTNKFVSNNILNVPPQNATILKNPEVIEDHFAEGLALYFMGAQMDLFIQEKNHFKIVIDTHIQIYE